MESKCGNRVRSALKQRADEFVAQMQELVGKLNFAQTVVKGSACRVDLRPLFDFVSRGVGKWAPGRSGSWDCGCGFFQE